MSARHIKKYLHSYIQALRFLYYKEFRNLKGIEQKTIKLRHAKYMFSAHVYWPRKSNAKTVLIVHGMTLRGCNDERYVNLCRALAKLGFTTVIPCFSSIQNLEISPKQFDEAAAAIQAVCQRKDICPEQKLGLFSSSFSGLISLKAATKKEVIPLVSSIMAIGAPASSGTIVRYALSNENIDTYAMWIMLINYLPYIMAPKKKVGKGNVPSGRR